MSLSTVKYAIKKGRADVRNHSVFPEGVIEKKWKVSNSTSKASKTKLPKTKRFFEILRGKLEIIQFIHSDKYMDGPGQGLGHFLSKSV